MWVHTKLCGGKCMADDICHVFFDCILTAPAFSLINQVLCAKLMSNHEINEGKTNL